MKWCRFKTDNGISFGLIEGDQVTEVEGNPILGEYKKTSRKHPLSKVKLELPVVPPTFYCVGINYADHVRRMAIKRGKEPEYPKKPDIGYRTNNALLPHGEPIVKPRDAGEKFQYEGELVAVFGKKCRNVSKEEALSYVFGWTIGNDVSERDWQALDRTMWRSKNADTFKPMGPWIETDVGDLNKLETTIKVNGEVKDKFKTNNMIFDAPTYISTVSQYCTIYPGDVMWMGTDGVPENIKPGDVVDIEITNIGTLSNPVILEK
jgi:2-keto-4-pentenoate hydratase/2-oxohepta-3-ene-1,7-dioic acid hydratase in catechol pathway